MAKKAAKRDTAPKSRSSGLEPTTEKDRLKLISESDDVLADEEVQRSTENLRIAEQLCNLANSVEGVEDEDHQITVSSEQAGFLEKAGLEVEIIPQGGGGYVNTVEFVEAVNGEGGIKEQFEIETPPDVSIRPRQKSRRRGGDERTEEGKTASASETGDAQPS